MVLLLGACFNRAILMRYERVAQLEVVSYFSDRLY